MTPTYQARRAMALTLGFDVMTATMAMAVAIALRWLATGGAPPDAVRMAVTASAIFGLSALVSFVLLGVHRQVWRHMGASDVIRIVQAVALSILIFLPIVFIWNRLVGLPRTSLALALVIWTTALFVGRMVALGRSTQRPFQLFRRVRKDAPAAILVGDAPSAAEAIRELQKAPDGAKVRLLGLVQTDQAEPGRAIRGVPVMGHLDDLGNVLDVLTLRYGKAPWVCVTGKALDHAQMTPVLEVAALHKAEIMALGAGGASVVKPLRTADLLSRPQRGRDLEPIANLVNDRKVLITGGGGTIGSELARQCAALGPESLTIFEASEYNLYAIDLELREAYPGLGVHQILGNVRDAARLDQSFRKIAPDIVIHAAALKHVPLMEENVCEAILTNVLGAINTMKAAAEAGAGRFVFISTDKAVDPDNVMGATKRLAEIALCRLAVKTGITVSMVRFGNVLGSSGSVVPLFSQQIDRKGPVTVTHPEVTRYFMTVDEAAGLVLRAGALQQPGSDPGLYVLDMGDPIRIEALAESMIRLRGLVPGKDVQIVYTGLRPGEKLHEQLTYAHEDIDKTAAEGIYRVIGTNAVDDSFDLMLAQLINAASKRDRSEALRLLGRLVPDYASRADRKLRIAQG